MKKNRLLIIMLIIGGLFLNSISVYADMNVGGEPIMTISPPQQKIVLIPGEVFEGSISVSNAVSATHNLKYSVTIGSFSLGKDEKGNVDYNDTDTDTITSYNQIMEWIELKKTSGSVAPNTTDVVPFSIRVPVDAPAGGQYATIIIQNDTEDSNEGDGNVNIKNVVRFAASILAEVTGETREEGSILENSIPSFILSNTLTAESKVRNDGNVHVDASYVLQVWPLFSNEEYCTNEEEPTTSLIMPETERYHTESCSLPSFGIFRAKQTVKVFNETSEVEKYIIVCPIWLLFIIIFALILLVLWIVARVKASKKREA